MIERRKAEKILSKVEYQRKNIGPSSQAIRLGISMPVYFSPDISGVYAYGENGKVEGYICPQSKENDVQFLQRMIGYRKPIVVESP